MVRVSLTGLALESWCVRIYMCMYISRPLKKVGLFKRGRVHRGCRSLGRISLYDIVCASGSPVFCLETELAVYIYIYIYLSLSLYKGPKSKDPVFIEALQESKVYIMRREV